MCGIAGFFRAGGLAGSTAGIIAERLSKTLQHRGPDDAGTWVDGDAGIALGHRRLAVLELSTAGRQPMISASGRYVIVFNGEIYNHLEIRTEIESGEVIPTLRRFLPVSTAGKWRRRSREPSGCLHSRCGTGRTVY